MSEYRFVDEGTVNGIRYVTVLDTGGNPIAYTMDYGRAQAEYGDMETRAMIRGREAGTNAGSWVIDGNTSQETALAIIRGYEDGDPVIEDMQPSPLSGEWADGPTPRSLAEDLGISQDDDEAIEAVASAYEDGFTEAYWAEVIRAARVTLGQE